MYKYICLIFIGLGAVLEKKLAHANSALSLWIFSPMSPCLSCPSSPCSPSALPLQLCCSTSFLDSISGAMTCTSRHRGLHLVCHDIHLPAPWPLLHESQHPGLRPASYNETLYHLGPSQLDLDRLALFHLIITSFSCNTYSLSRYLFDLWLPLELSSILF